MKKISTIALTTISVLTLSISVPAKAATFSLYYDAGGVITQGSLFTDGIDFTSTQNAISFVGTRGTNPITLVPTTNPPPGASQLPPNSFFYNNVIYPQASDANKLDNNGLLFQDSVTGNYYNIWRTSSTQYTEDFATSSNPDNKIDGPNFTTLILAVPFEFSPTLGLFIISGLYVSKKLLKSLKNRQNA